MNNKTPEAGGVAIVDSPKVETAPNTRPENNQPPTPYLTDRRIHREVNEIVNAAPLAAEDNVGMNSAASQQLQDESISGLDQQRVVSEVASPASVGEAVTDTTKLQSAEYTGPFAEAEKFMAGEEAKRERDPNIPARERDNANRRIRDAERAYLKKQPDDIVRHLAPKHQIAREMYMDRLEGKLVKEGVDAHTAIDQQVEEFRKILEEAGLPHNRIVANTAERRRILTRRNRIKVNPRVLGPHETSIVGKVRALSSDNEENVVGNHNRDHEVIVNPRVKRLAAVNDLMRKNLASTGETEVGVDVRTRTKSSARRSLLATATALSEVGKSNGEGDVADTAIQSPISQGNETIMDSSMPISDMTSVDIPANGQAVEVVGRSALPSVGNSGETDTNEADNLRQKNVVMSPAHEGNDTFGVSNEDHTNAGPVGGVAATVVQAETPATADEGTTRGKAEPETGERRDHTSVTFTEGEVVSQKLMDIYGDNWDNPDLIEATILMNYDKLKGSYEQETGQTYPSKEEIMKQADAAREDKGDVFILLHNLDLMPVAGGMAHSTLNIPIEKGIKNDTAEIKAEDARTVVTPVSENNVDSGAAVTSGESNKEFGAIAAVEGGVVQQGDDIGGSVGVDSNNTQVAPGAVTAGDVVVDDTADRNVVITQHDGKETTNKSGGFLSSFGRAFGFGRGKTKHTE